LITFIIFTAVFIVAAESVQALPTDDFQIGDRVVVSGTKSGIIVFIGEVHFSSGEWAGVVLDTPTGKNDGKIGGRRYFMCEPMRGVFCRLEKLTKLPGGGGTVPPSQSASTSQPSDAMSASPGHFGSSAGMLKSDSPNLYKSDVVASSLPKVPNSKPLSVAVEKPSSPFQGTSSQEQCDSGIPTPSSKTVSTCYSNGDDHMITRFWCFL